MTHNRKLYEFCCWGKEKLALYQLERYDDIDILSYEYDIIRIAIAKDQSRLLKAMLEYFEKIQFPDRNDEYNEARDELIYVLEESYDYRSTSPQIKKLISQYLGYDIANLEDFNDNSDNDDEPLSEEEKLDLKTISVLPKSSNLEECIEAARNCNTEVIRQNLDMSNKAYKLMVISTAVQSNQGAIIDTLVDMAEGAAQKASILRMSGDKYTQADLFAKAEECYNKSLELHQSYYVTYYKMGALYQRWAVEGPFSSNLGALKQKAIDNYTMALECVPIGRKSEELNAKLELISQQLKLLSDVVSIDRESSASSSSSSDQRDSSDSENHNAFDELLSYLSEEEEDVVVVSGAAEITETE